MMDFGPICSACTRDWDERLGYCEYCDSIDGEDTVTEKKKTKKKLKLATVTPLRRRGTDTPVYDQLTIDFGFAPDQSADWRNMPGSAGLLEDNFS